MRCRHCKAEVVETAKFCQNCGKPIPGAASIGVTQKAGLVKGTMTGLAAGKEALPDGVQAEVGQTIDMVESGGIVTGTVLGGEEGPIHVGGLQQYGDTVQGDKRTTYRSAFDQRGQTVHSAQTNIEGGVHTGGGIFNSGVMNPGAAPTKVDVLGELRQLLAMVKQAGEEGTLDEERVIDVESALRKAAIQAEKGQPKAGLIIDHLTKAQVIVAEVAPAHSLAVAIQKLLGMVGRWG